MAIGDPYVSLEELKDYLKITGKESLDDVVQDALTSATSEINKKCNRQFNRTDTATERKFYFEPEHRYSHSMAKVDDFHTTTDLAVVLDGVTLVEDTDFELSPLNGIVDGEPGWPYWRIKLLRGHRFHNYALLGGAPLKVTARWGWAAIPAPIKQACLIMAAETFQLKDAPLGVAGMDAFGSALRVRDNQMAINKLGPYIRRRILVG